MIHSIEINTEDEGMNMFEGEVTINGEDLFIKGVCEVKVVKEHAGGYDTGFGNQFVPWDEIDWSVRVWEGEYLYPTDTKKIVPVKLIEEIQTKLNEIN